jgi:transcriptional/translational regulatory protein YebC/TACO1
MFQRKGVILVDKASAPDEEGVLDTALEAGAEDLSDAESHWEITTDPSAIHDVKAALEAAGMELASAEVTMAPSMSVPVAGSQARSVLNLVEALEDNEDVQAVYANFDIPEEVLAEVS